MNRRIIIVLALMFVFFNCKEEKKKQISDIPVVERYNFKQINSIKFNDPDYFEKTEFIKLETTDESILAEITQLEVYEDHIYILDQRGKSVKKFDLTGKYMHDIGRVGLGSGEYIAVNAFYINPQTKTINVVDPMKNAVLRYDLTGKHIETVKSDNRDLAFIGRLSYLKGNEIFCLSGANWQGNCAFSILNEKNYESKCLYRYPIKSDKQIGWTSLNQHSYTIRDGVIHFVLFFSDTIYSYHDNEISKFLLLDSDKPAYDYNQISKIGSENDNDFLVTIAKFLNDSEHATHTLGLRNIFESDLYICCTTFGMIHTFLWNKTTGEGIGISENPSPAPRFGSIEYCFDNTFVRFWNMEQISEFKENSKENGSYNKDDYPAELWNVLANYNEEDDNPILIFYTLKK